MINEIKGKTINDVVYKTLDKLVNAGHKSTSRNGNVHFLNNVALSLESPKSRHLNLIGRRNNIFATIAETFWVMAGDININPFLSFYLPRAKDFSDDGETWYGGYGTRLYKYDQLQDVIQQFKNEGIYTRRASFYIGTPELDTHEQFSKTLGKDKVLDRPCNMAGTFFVDENKRLCLNMFSRSGDILWGIGSINIFEWTYLQEMVLQVLKAEVDPELTLGEYTHFVTNIHLYEFTGEQGYMVLENQQTVDVVCEDDIVFPDTIENNRLFHKDLVSLLTDNIENDHDWKDSLFKLEILFNKYDVPVSNNLLFKYAEVVLAYTFAKKGNLIPETVVSEFGDEFTSCIKNSKFRKFDLGV